MPSFSFFQVYMYARDAKDEINQFRILIEHV